LFLTSIVHLLLCLNHGLNLLFSHFLADFQSFFCNVATLPHDFIITDDFTIHVYDLYDSNTQQFMCLLRLANLTQHVSFPIHRHLHTQDLVITTADSLLSPVIIRTVNSPSDHFSVFTYLHITPPKPSPLCKQSLRPVKSISIHSFIRDIFSSTLITHPPSNLSDLVECYNSTLSSLPNKHDPVITKNLRLKPSNPWFFPVLSKLKLARRRLNESGLIFTHLMII
jgi:hypothetical protein